jgi:hypothetical protein
MPHRSGFWILVLITWLKSDLGTGASVLDQWQERNPLPTNNLAAVTFGSGLFIAVGDALYKGEQPVKPAIIRTSPDGVAWTTPSVGSASHLFGAASGNGIFVAVGARGTVLTSANGFEWEAQNPGVTNDLFGIAYGNGAFVVVGGDQEGAGMHVILTSTNGVEWTLRASGTNVLFDVVFGESKFVAVGRYFADRFSHSVVLTSEDGLAWNRLETDFHFGVKAIAYGANQFVAVGTYSRGGAQGYAIVSKDGTNWTRTEQIGLGIDLLDITFGNGTFVLVGSHSYIADSVDGLDWRGRFLDTTRHLVGVAYGKGTFVAVGTAGMIVQSQNVAVPSIGRPSFTEKGATMTVSGEIGRRYRVQSSRDISTWTDIGAFTNRAPMMDFVDPLTTEVAQRFYRVISP